MAPYWCDQCPIVEVKQTDQCPLPSHPVSCVARIYSGIPPNNNKQSSSFSPEGKLKQYRTRIEFIQRKISIHTYHLCFIPEGEGIAKTQIFLRDTPFYQNDLQ
jgi:hypothetical protein